MKKLFFVILISAFLSACGFRPIMPERDMSIIPLPAGMPEKFVVVYFPIPSHEDIAGGIGGKTSWPAYLIKDKVVADSLAINVGDITGKEKAWITLIPASLDEVIGSKLAITDRCSEMVYNHLGKSQKLNVSILGSIQWDKHFDFLTEIKKDQSFAKEIKKDSKEFEAFLGLYGQLPEAKKIGDTVKYAYGKYKPKFGSVFTEQELEGIAKRDSVIGNFAHWLGSGWKAVFAYPLLSPTQIGAYALIVKVFDLPKLWNDTENRVGCMGYKPTAKDVSEMVLRGVKGYGNAVTTVAPMIPASGKTALPVDLREKIREKTGKDFSTYDDYNLWVVEQ